MDCLEIEPKEMSQPDIRLKELFPCLSSQSNKFQMSHLVAKEQSIQQVKHVLRVGVVLSGGQAPGGHNVISGLFDFLKKYHVNSQLFGFFDGPRGIINGKYIEVSPEFMDCYRNQGGFDMLCSGRDKIESTEQKQKSLQVCLSLDLDGLVVIGGDDSNTNAAVLAEYFLQQKKEQPSIKSICVVGCPKTIDGDLKNEWIDVSFGFDTACKVYSELIGNLCVDCLSSKNHYHFVRVMGRSASHIALECMLQTRSNLVILSEEVEHSQTTLQQCVEQLLEVIVARHKLDRNYGVILVPEGLIEFFPDVKRLIQQINSILGGGTHQESHSPTKSDESSPNKQQQNLTEEEKNLSIFNKVVSQLTQESKEVFLLLPKSIQEQLLLDRDPHGNVQVAKIDTEKLLVSLAQEQLYSNPKYKGLFKQGQFTPCTHYFGYEGRCALPSNFDADYCYALGKVAGVLVQKRRTGEMATLQNLHLASSEWQPCGVPLIPMMTIEVRKGKNTPVIKKSLVEMDSPCFKIYQARKQEWALNDCYVSPGGIQFSGPVSISDITNHLVDVPRKLQNQSNDLNKVIAQFYSTQECKFGSYSNRSFEGLSPLEAYRADTNQKCAIPTMLEEFKFVANKSALEVDKLVLDQLAQQYGAYAAQGCRKYIQIQHTKSTFHNSPCALRIGLVFCSKQAPGGNNIADGLLRYQKANPETKLFGFLGGVDGIYNLKYLEITENNFKAYRNQGGYSFLGRGADKLRDPNELKLARSACEELNLDGLVMVGATHTLTDALILTDYFLQEGVPTKVVGVPASVDGTVKHSLIESVVGFDTASKLYSQLIGNIMTDAASAKKYWYFIRLMGMNPSHLVLETALQTHPNHVIISEEHAKAQDDLDDVVQQIANTVQQRSLNGKNFGTVLIPEGLLHHLPYMRQLIEEINRLFKQQQVTYEFSEKLVMDLKFAKTQMKPWSAKFMHSLPLFTRRQLLLNRNVQGGMKFSSIDTERLLSHLVKQELKRRNAPNLNFSSVEHFFGYQGRSAMPSHFDCSLASTLGYTAAVLIQEKLTGYCTGVQGVLYPPAQWTPSGFPLSILTSLKYKSGAYGKNRSVVAACDVDLLGKPYELLKKKQIKWILSDHYSNSGPIQLCEVNVLNFRINKTTKVNHKDYQKNGELVKQLCTQIAEKCQFGTASGEVLQVSIHSLNALLTTLNILTKSQKYVF